MGTVHTLYQLCHSRTNTLHPAAGTVHALFWLLSLQCWKTVVLQCRTTVVLQCGKTVVLQCGKTVVLQCMTTVVLQRGKTVVLHCTAAVGLYTQKLWWKKVVGKLSNGRFFDKAKSSFRLWQKVRVFDAPEKPLRPKFVKKSSNHSQNDDFASSNNRRFDNFLSNDKKILDKIYRQRLRHSVKSKRPCLQHWPN